MLTKQIVGMSNQSIPGPDSRSFDNNDVATDLTRLSNTTKNHCFGHFKSTTLKVLHHVRHSKGLNFKSGLYNEFKIHNVLMFETEKDDCQEQPNNFANEK